jgi:hypothetical protein
VVAQGGNECVLHYREKSSFRPESGCHLCRLGCSRSLPAKVHREENRVSFAHSPFGVQATDASAWLAIDAALSIKEAANAELTDALGSLPLKGDGAGPCVHNARAGGRIGSTDIRPDNNIGTTHRRLSLPDGHHRWAAARTRRLRQRHTRRCTRWNHVVRVDARVILGEPVIGACHAEAVLRTPTPLRRVIGGRVERDAASHAARECSRDQRRRKKERAHEQPCVAGALRPDPFSFRQTVRPESRKSGNSDSDCGIFLKPPREARLSWRVQFGEVGQPLEGMRELLGPRIGCHAHGSAWACLSFSRMLTQSRETVREFNRLFEPRPSGSGLFRVEASVRPRSLTVAARNPSSGFARNTYRLAAVITGRSHAKP